MLKTIASRVRAVIVPEMNAGQLCLEVERLCPDAVPVIPVNRIDGEPIEPHQIVAAVETAAGTTMQPGTTLTRQA
jgi:2-oxoglutarate ferredoxin oxidoreductase subunit alpha